jgi:ppGpp synthetase/RelA/SpoT-type nucleotidyltranferase
MMKIPRSVRELYDSQLEKNEQLKVAVDRAILSKKNQRWHYESRIKAAESFALKIETGRFHPERLEDFFACTIVVENQSRIREAEALIRTLFDISERRPLRDSFTSKRSESFPFDDLRLYVTYKDDSTLPPSGMAGFLFEVQIKTFLQHAWAIATHDLTYKTESVSWATERIAFQIKAMLEHAEISISAAEQLAGHPDLGKVDAYTRRIEKFTTTLKQLWPDGAVLPSDIVRFAKNVSDLCSALKLDRAELKGMIERETAEGRGTQTINLSPYGIILQAVFIQYPQKVRDFLSNDSNEFRLFIPREVEIPSEFEQISSSHIMRT